MRKGFKLKTKNHIEETDLVAGLQRHEHSFLEYLYDHYSGTLYSIILRIVRKEEVAQEVLHDAFIKIWDKIGSYDSSKGKLFTWLLNVTRNLAIDRTRSKEISQLRKTDDIDLLVNKIDKQEQSFSEVESIGIKEVLQRLPEEQKFIVEQLYLKGYTQSEVAEEFNIPLGTVKTRLRLAMTELRTLLNIR